MDIPIDDRNQVERAQEVAKAPDYLQTPCSELGGEISSFLDLTNYDPTDPGLENMLAPMPVDTPDIAGIGTIPDIFETPNDNNCDGPSNTNTWQTFSTMTPSHRTPDDSSEYGSQICLKRSACPLTTSTAITRITFSNADVLDRFLSSTHTRELIENDLACTLRICIRGLRTCSSISSSARRPGQLRSQAEARAAIEGTCCVDYSSFTLTCVVKHSVPGPSGKFQVSQVFALTYDWED